jgi:hypothetical protein
MTDAPFNMSPEKTESPLLEFRIVYMYHLWALRRHWMKESSLLPENSDEEKGSLPGGTGKALVRKQTTEN